MNSLTRRSFVGQATALIAAGSLTTAPAKAALAAGQPPRPRVVTYTAGDPGMRVNSHLIERISQGGYAKRCESRNSRGS